MSLIEQIEVMCFSIRVRVSNNPDFGITSVQISHGGILGAKDDNLHFVGDIVRPPYLDI